MTSHDRPGRPRRPYPHFGERGRSCSNVEKRNNEQNRCVWSLGFAAPSDHARFEEASKRRAQRPIGARFNLGEAECGSFAINNCGDADKLPGISFARRGTVLVFCDGRLLASSFLLGFGQVRHQRVPCPIPWPATLASLQSRNKLTEPV